jgi:phospholipid-translocating ATPase
VLAITMLKEANDDYQRYQRDREANSQLYGRFTPTGLVDVPSSDIRVGDIIQVKKDQRIPADMVLLRTTERSGSMFIRTDQLDGEIDWKMRVAVSCCQKLSSDYDLFNLNAFLYADRPHKDIYTFIGTFTHATDEGDATESLNVEHTLWMNTVVASGVALGVVIYTGRETRAVMNTSRPKTKMGITDAEINKLSKVLCVVVVAMSVVMLMMKGWHGPWWVYLIRFIVLFSTIIPISMRVNLDMGKSMYASEIMRDRKIPGVIVRTSTLPEELGRVQYLLTDKTGTLTKNDMELKKLHLGTMCYGPESKDDVHGQLVSAVGKGDRRSPPSGQRGRRDQTQRVFETMLALALCHNVTPVIEEDGEIVYQASSPDEVAIVKWCEVVGMVLLYRDRESIKIQLAGTLLVYDILHIFPFTSETKRMGIIVRDTGSGEISFLEKGADAMMAKIVLSNDWLEEECSNMAREGLRTLVVGKKRLSQEQYNVFDAAYQKARVSIQDRNQQMQDAVERILEKDLDLLAVTGVEDKLQDDVRITLEKLRNAGIRIWMLTGDKVETATNIAISTRLFSRDKHILQYQKLALDECPNVISSIGRIRNCCLVIDGPSLHLIMTHMPAEFMKVSLQLEAVVCCRCTPTQKADVARMIQQYSKKRVCCIGDGGNDVSMIQAADVGVGIVGKEGRQASLAADFSVLQFSHLMRLLIWHGRNSYKRTSKLALFVIHRGVVIASMQAVFSAIFYFSPIALFQGLIAVGYTTVYTMAPVFSLVLDKDVSDEVAMQYVELYRDLTKGRELTYKTFFKCLMTSVYQGGVIMMLAIWLFERDFIHIVSITFTALILNELLMIALEINTWHYVMGIAEIGSFLIYVASVRLLKDYFDARFTTSVTFFWKVALITLVSFLPLYVFSLLKHLIAPTSATKLST